MSNLSTPNPGKVARPARAARSPRLEAQKLQIEAMFTRTQLSREEAARRLLLKPDTLRKYQMGYQPASERMMQMIRRMEKEFGRCRRAWSTDSRLRVRDETTIRSIPRASWAQAGLTTRHRELELDWKNIVPGDCDDMDAFALVLHGDSMEPRYQDGDILVLRPNSPPRQGCLVVARLADRSVVFKIFSRTGSRIRFSSYNPAYDSFESAASEVTWVFPVDSVLKKVWV